MKTLASILAVVAALVTACGPSTPATSTPASTGPDPAAAAGTAPPPSLGPPVFVTAQEEWEKKICACKDNDCIIAAGQPSTEGLVSTTQEEARLNQQWMPRYLAAGARANGCRMKIFNKDAK